MLVDIAMGRLHRYDAMREAATGLQVAEDMTCISCALENGVALLRNNRRDGALPGLLILLTDGRQTAGGTDRTAIYRCAPPLEGLSPR